jgi:hypothetical protein
MLHRQLASTRWVDRRMKVGYEDRILRMKFDHVLSLRISCLHTEFCTDSLKQPVLEGYKSLCGKKLSLIAYIRRLHQHAVKCPNAAM